MTRFCLSRNTEPCICPDRPIDFTSAALSFAFLMTPRTVVTVAFHQSSGSCSLHSGLGWYSGYSAVASARIFPRSLIAIVFVPDVPMSMPKKVLMRKMMFLGAIGRRDADSTGFRRPMASNRMRDINLMGSMKQRIQFAPCRILLAALIVLAGCGDK